MTGSIAARPITAFTILACAFGWVLYIAAALGVPLSPGTLPLGPIIAAAIVAAMMGRPELKKWARGLLALRASPAWYAVAVVAPVAIVILAVLANYALGAPLPTASQLAEWPDLLATLAFFLVLIGIGEEAGWTAFAAPRLLDRHPFLTAWMMLSAIRVTWHLPLMLSGDLPWSLGIGGNAAFQLLVLWIFLRSGRVWFLAAIWHAMLNTTGGTFFFQMVQGEDQSRLALLMTAGYIIAAAAVLLLDRRGVPGVAFTPRRFTRQSAEPPL